MHAERTNSRHRLVIRLGSFFFTVVAILLLVLPGGTCSFANTLEDEEPDYPEIFKHLSLNLEHYYWDQRRIQPRYQLERALSSLENAADEIYVEYTGRDNRRFQVHVGENSRIWSLRQVDSLEKAFDTLEEVFEFLKRHYRGKSTLNEIRVATANGFLTGLDPHTMVFSRKAFEEFYVHIEGEIYGVGMLVGLRGDGKLTVIEVLKGTPAHRAGFRKGDLIAKIDDESTINMSVNEAVKKIRGKKGTEVVLTVKRKVAKKDEQEGKLESLAIPVTRDRVQIKSVESKLLPGSIGYIQVTNFDKNTSESLREHLDRLSRQNGNRELAGLILDLRGNSGGLLQQASEMADMFLKSGTLYSIATRDGVTSHGARNANEEPQFPIVALCDEASASGAEIVIGALQQNQRAVVLGAPTFGKGTVQQLHPLPPHIRFFSNYKAQLKITVSEYLIPNEISIQENGVMPDVLGERILFGEKDIDFVPNKRRGTEKDYKHHIVSKYAREQKPLEEIQYPLVYRPPEDEVGDDFMSGDIKPLENKLVQVAVKMLELANRDGAEKPFRSRAFLERNREGIDQIRAELQEEIVAHLKERGIDWSAGANGSEKPEVKVDIHHEIFNRPAEDEDGPPEKVLKITARLTNLSKRPLYRLAGISTSDQMLYEDREFLFGKVGPGETVERSVELLLRPSSATRSDLFTLEVRGPGHEEPVAISTHEVILEGENFPEFGYSLTLRDGRTGSTVSRLEPGMDVNLLARIKNVGTATVKKGVAILRNKNGKDIFLDVGRLEVDDLKPGGTEEVEFKFRVREDSRLNAFKFEFGVFGAYYPSGLSREFEIPASRDGGAFRSGEWFQLSSIALKVAVENNGKSEEKDERAVLRTDRDTIELSAEIEDRDAPFHAWVAISPLGNHQDRAPDKVYFEESRPDDGHRLTLNTRVPLEVGQNVLSVVATSERGLTRRRILFVRRVPAPEKLGRSSAVK